MSQPRELASPLALVTHQASVHELIRDLSSMRERVEASMNGDPIEVRFSRGRIARVQQEFLASIRRGEAKLHRLCDLVCAELYESPYVLTSVVVAELPIDGQRFAIRQPLSPDELFAQTDLALGSRMVANFRYRVGDTWEAPRLVANYVEYEPELPNRYRIHKMISRIKAEEEIWNKVVDELFRIDEIVKHDRQLNRFSRFVKDIFGLKIVVDDAEYAYQVHDAIADCTWPRERRASAGVPIRPDTERFLIVETKDYLDPSTGKRSGWSAIKSSLEWWDAMFEIQVQPLENYFRERERNTRESHWGFKLKREEIRDEVAREVPLFGFVRDLLEWLFRRPDSPAPAHDRVVVYLDD